MTSSNKFRRVDDLDSSRITVKIWKDDEGTKGEVYGPTIVQGGTISMPISMHQGILTGEKALDLAVRMSKQLNNAEIVVWLDAGDWDPEWGQLIDA